MNTKSDDGLRARMATLLKTPVPTLRKRLAATGQDPAGLSRDALVKALASTEAPAAATTAKAPKAGRKSGLRDARLPAPGTTIEREYKGKRYKVEVLERGFRHDGKEWRSLTAIAKAVTGYASISGTLFFGISHRKGAEPKPATETPAPAKTAKAPRAPKSKRARGKK